jgi:hypothetical protein
MKKFHSVLSAVFGLVGCVIASVNPEKGAVYLLAAILLQLWSKDGE